jgi:hypothetical protein
VDYNEVQTVSYGYADREDQETIDRYDDFLRIVEARINRQISTLKLTNRASLPMDENQERYGLPNDFEGMIDLQITGTDGQGRTSTRTAEYRTPSRIQEIKNNNVDQTSGTNGVYYNIINNELLIIPTQEDTNTIEMTYYRRIPELTTNNLTNWISEDNPDCYVFGVLTEISAFVKDANAAALWGGRFDSALQEIKNNDIDIRWDSGTALQIRRV